MGSFQNEQMATLKHSSSVFLLNFTKAKQNESIMACSHFSQQFSAVDIGTSTRPDIC
jgi:hypothetical protein